MTFDCWLVLALCLPLVNVLANTEKQIFLAPEALSLTKAQPGLDHLDLQYLTHDRSHLRTTLARSFANDSRPHGLSSWFLLGDLEERSRYELRLCWSATEPTDFWIDTYTVQDVFSTPALLQDLAAFSEARSLDPARKQQDQTRLHQEGAKSILFLRINSAADYFTSNVTLMINVPAVNVDLILDPYLLGVLPRSMGSTALYICCLGIIGWFLSGKIFARLAGLMRDGKRHKDPGLARMRDMPNFKLLLPGSPGHRSSHLFTMPWELILDIVDRLDPRSMINLAFAYYPLLQRFGVIPTMSTGRLLQLVERSRLSTMFAVVPLPAELLLQTMRHLNTMDLMRFVLANYHDLAARKIAPLLTDDTMQSLLEACND